MRPATILFATVISLAAFAAGASAQVVTDADWAPTSRPRDMDGSWFGRIVRAEDESLEGSEVMYAAHPRVLRNVILRFSASNPDEIASAAINEYGGVREKDGGFLLRGKNVAVTTDGWMTAGDDVGCVSVSFDDTKETMYAYAKSSGVDTFEQCPAVPDPEVFENDAVDLEAAHADCAVLLRRARLALRDESFGLSAARDAGDLEFDAAWPRGMPGLWRGTVVMSDPKYVSTAGATPAYLSVFQNLAPNVWLFLDPKDETKIASANVGLMRSVVRNPDGSFEFHNEAWKSFPGAEHVAGRDDWCNAFVLVKNDEGDAQIVMLSNSRAHAEGDDDDAPECPEAPDAMSSLGEGDERLGTMLAESPGAVSVARLTKQ